MLRENLAAFWAFIGPYLELAFKTYYVEIAFGVFLVSGLIGAILHRVDGSEMDFDDAFNTLGVCAILGAAWPLVIGLGGLGILIYLFCSAFMLVANFKASALTSAVKNARMRWKAYAPERAARKQAFINRVLSIKGRTRIRAIRAVKGEDHIPLSKEKVERVIDV